MFTSVHRRWCLYKQALMTSVYRVKELQDELAIEKERGCQVTMCLMLCLSRALGCNCDCLPRLMPFLFLQTSIFFLHLLHDNSLSQGIVLLSARSCLVEMVRWALSSNDSSHLAQTCWRLHCIFDILSLAVDSIWHAPSSKLIKEMSQSYCISLRHTLH